MTTGNRGILGVGAYTPERVMTNEDWSQHVDTSDEWIRTRTGIERRRFAAEGETTVDLAASAAEGALADAGLSVDEIDELILATDTPEVTCPDTAAYVQERMGFGEIIAYDLAGSGCAGWVLALDIAHSRAAGGRNVLVVGVELISRLMDWTDRNTCVLFGDAGGAAVVGEGPNAVRLLASDAGTDGSHASILGREVGGTRTPITEDVVQRGDHLQVVMNGREVFKEAVKRMTQSSQVVLEAAGKTIDDLALLVPHQANERILRAVGKQLGIESDRVMMNVAEYGNTGSASVPVALRQALDANRVERGDLVLLTSFGAGFHWASALLQF